MPEDSDIQDIKGVAGQTVGLESEESTRFLDAMLDAAGVPKDDVDTAVVGTSGPLVAKTLEDDKIQAYVGNASDFTALGGQRRSAAQHHARGRRPDRRQPAGDAAGHAAGEAGGHRRLPARLGEGSARRSGEPRGHGGHRSREGSSRVAQRGERRGRARPRHPADEAGRSRAHRGPATRGLGDGAGGSDRAGILEEEVNVDAALNDELIAEINDFDRAEVERAAEQWAQENN